MLRGMCRVDLGHHQPRLGHGRRDHVHRHTQADVPKLVGQGDLDESHVHLDAADADEPGTRATDMGT
jgi:hypothetical protein